MYFTALHALTEEKNFLWFIGLALIFLNFFYKYFKMIWQELFFNSDFKWVRAEKSKLKNDEKKDADTFVGEAKSAINWFKNLSPGLQNFLNLLIIVIIILVTQTEKNIIGPAILVCFWSVFSLENSTLEFKTLIFLMVIGMFVVLPVAVLLEFPLGLMLNNYSKIFLSLAVLIETSLLVVGIGFFYIYPKSNLRYTASILDFALIGLCLGAGLEIGIGFLAKSAITYQGLSLGIFPQCPGLLGKLDMPQACASPITWGLSLGLVIGVMRYLLGSKILVRPIIWWVIAGLLNLIIVFLLERLAYHSNALKGMSSLLYAIDLEGRLLTYVSILLTGIVLISENIFLKQKFKLRGVFSLLVTIRNSIYFRKKNNLKEIAKNLREFYSERKKVRKIIFTQESKSIFTHKDRKVLIKRSEDLEKDMVNK